MLVGVEQVNISKVQDLAGGIDAQAERVATEIGVIRARDMAQRVIEKLGLETIWNSIRRSLADRAPIVAGAAIDTTARLAHQDRGGLRSVRAARSHQDDGQDRR